MKRKSSKNVVLYLTQPCPAAPYSRTENSSAPSPTSSSRIQREGTGFLLRICYHTEPLSVFVDSLFFKYRIILRKTYPAICRGAFHGSYESLKEKQKKLERFDAKKVPVFAMTANAFI